MEEGKREWFNGTFTAPDMAGTIQLNAEAIGRVRAVAEIAELDYDQICGERT